MRAFCANRGYPIDQLAEKSSFLEVAYLLLYGELPTADQFSKFDHDITYHTMVHEKVNSFISGFHYNAHPIGDHVRRGRIDGSVLSRQARCQ